MTEFITILGNLPRKSNSRRIVANRRTGKPMVIKSADALAYERSFMAQIPARLKTGMEGPLALSAVIYYRNPLSDLSDELLCDLIEKSGMIKNDRQFVYKVLTKKIDRLNPRVEFGISRVIDK